MASRSSIFRKLIFFGLSGSDHLPVIFALRVCLTYAE